MKKSLKWFAIALTIMMVFSVSFFTYTQAADSEETIRIGCIFPHSGNLAMLGEESFRGAELALELRNSQGGINGKKVEWVIADAPTPDAARSEAERLITREKVDILFGTYSSSLSVVASEVAERYGKIYFEGGAAADSIVTRGFNYTIRTQPTSSTAGEVSIQYPVEVLAPKLGIETKDLKVVVVHEDSVFGTAIAEGCQRQADKMGVNILAIEPYSSTTNDMSSLILKIKDLEPNVLIAVSYLNDATLMWQQMKQLDFYVPMFISNGAGHSMKEFYDAVGGAEGLYAVDVAQFDVNMDFCPGLEDFIAAYQAKYGKDPSSCHSLIHYMGALEMFEIIEAAGSTDPDKIVEAAMKVDKPVGSTCTGWGVKFIPMGEEFGGQNERATQTVAMWTGDGKLVTVWPDRAQVAEPIVPFIPWDQR